MEENKENAYLTCSCAEECYSNYHKSELCHIARQTNKPEDMEENKKGWICCSVDTVNHGMKSTQMVVVDDFEKVKEFMKVNIESIKETVDDYIKDGTLSIVEEITEDNFYYLSLENNSHSMFECDSIWFTLDAFEFTYNIPFNFNSF